MASKVDGKTISQLFGSIAAAQTMVEQLPFSFGMNESGFTCSFDLLTTIFECISDKPLMDTCIEWFTEKLSDNDGAWLQWVEDIVKQALHANITNLLTCEMNPIIPDRLIGGGQFLINSDIPLNFSGEGITIPLSSLDFTGLLGNCPADESIAARSNYITCYSDDYYYSSIKLKDIPEDAQITPQETVPTVNVGDYIMVGDSYYVWSRRPLGIKELWKHDDFNAFLWYVKNKGVYSNLTERNKLMWDNRYKTKFGKYERKPESFFTKTNGMKNSDGFTMYNGESGIIPFDGAYLAAYNDNPNTRHKKRQIMEVRYLDGDGVQSDSFQFKLAASNYYKTATFSGKKKNKNDFPVHNKLIFQFNHDFIMSLKLYDAKTILYQILNNYTVQGNATFNFSITRESEIINEMIDEAIYKMLKIDDGTDDSYFTFSNDEYTEMMINLEKKRYNESYDNENNEIYSDIIDSIDRVSGEEIIDKTPEKYKEVLSNISNSITSGDTLRNNWSFKWDAKFELIRMLAYPLIRPLFTPKVMTLLLINTEIMGNPLKLGESLVDVEEIGRTKFEQMLKYLAPLIKNVVSQVKDILIEMLYNFVITKLTPILTVFSLKLMMEQLEYYRVLISDMINACVGAANRNNVNSPFNQVDYVDIITE